MSKQNQILVTGSSGFLGGTFCYELLKQGWDVIGLDNYTNSSDKNTLALLDQFPKNFTFYKCDLCGNLEILESIFKIHEPHAAAHFAALKSVSDSQQNPAEYWKNNMLSTFNLLQVMQAVDCSKLLYSSSAAVYGDQRLVPIQENNHCNPCSPYARTKLSSEWMIADLAIQYNINTIILRYFNPIGIHADRVITDEIASSRGSLMQEIIKTALGISKELTIYGDAHITLDGFCARDFIHVDDLIEAHIKSLSYLDLNTGVDTFNIGTGKAISILELINTFNLVSGMNLNIKISSPLEGEIASSCADVSKIHDLLGWKSTKNIYQMVEDTWDYFKDAR